MPDSGDAQAVRCLLDRARLGSIEGKLDLTLGKLEHLGSIDGPIGKIQQEILINRQMTSAAHKRIDAHDNVLERIGMRQWQIVWKTAAVVGGSGGVVFVLIKILETFAAR